MTRNTWSTSTGERKPSMLMQPIVDPAAWDAAEMARSEAWIYRLSDAENDEIERAVARAESSGKDLTEVGRADFPLPTLAPLLAEFQHELMLGRGFALLRGIRLDKLTKVQAAIAFWGIGLYMGRPISQNIHGHVLAHVKFQGGQNGQDRGYTTQGALGFHCDSADILGLGVVNTGKSGGEHRIVSSASVYNDLLKKHPEFVQVLGEPMHRSRSGDGFGNAVPWIVQRTFNFTGSYFSCRSAGGSVMAAQKYPEVPRLTPIQIEAMEAFKEASNRLSMVIPFQRGDFFYVTNHTNMHARSAYEDWPEPERKRHLMRIWLKNGLRPLPEEIGKFMEGTPTKAPRLSAVLEVA
jgi:hypothetical protein